MSNDEICCKKFNPSLWDDKKQTWHEKQFVSVTIPQIFHMPLPGRYGKAVEKMSNAIEKANASVDNDDFLMLANDPSPWKSYLYMNAKKSVPGIDNVKISGIFLTKVFDGQYKDIPKFISEMNRYVIDKGEKVLNYYFYYTTCPKCAKKYGHNYIVLFAKVA